MQFKILFLLFLATVIPLISSAQIDTLSDEFNRTCSVYEWKTVNQEEGWNASHLELMDINVTNEDRLTLMPWTTGWYANYRSNLIFKEVVGDFVFTTNVSATNRAENDIPGAQYSLAGTMVRTSRPITNGLPDWTPGGENYVFLSVGYAATNHPSCSGCPGPHFEVKNTINSNSNLNISSIDTAAALIRIVKIEDAIIVLYQLPGESFNIRQRYDRGDMPDTLQVGLVSYTDWSKVSTYTPAFLNSHTINANLNPDPSSNPNQPFNPDIIAKFDFARFESPIIPSHLVGLDFGDDNVVSDAEILSLFSYPSETNDESGWKIWKGNDSDWNNPLNWSGGVIPTSQDSILIPNCGCPEMVYPLISSGSYTYSSFKTENGGQITILPGASITVDLLGSNSRFINQGLITCEGTLIVENSLNKQLINTGSLDCSLAGTCTFME